MRKAFASVFKQNYSLFKSVPPLKEADFMYNVQPCVVFSIYPFVLRGHHQEGELCSLEHIL